MKTLGYGMRLLALAGLLAQAGTAEAADIHKDGAGTSLKDAPVIVPYPSFAGFYFGGNLGYAWGDVSVGDLDRYNPSDGWSYEAGAFAAGVQLGHNWQRGATLFGIEGELGYMDLLGLDDNGADPASPGGDTVSSVNGGLFGALTGRLGAVSGATLLYAKGGVAFLNAGVNVDDGCAVAPCGGATLEVNGEDTLIGWTIGGGIERALSPGWTVKAEYMYYDFGSIDAEGITSELETTHWRHDVTVHSVKFGVNRLFGKDREALQ